jgi:hypothetical protein
MRKYVETAKQKWQKRGTLSECNEKSTKAHTIRLKGEQAADGTFHFKNTNILTFSQTQS